MTEHTITLRHPKLLSLYALWLEQCLDGPVPLATMLDPVPLRPWISNLLVMDVVSNDSIVYSYYGRNFADAFGDKLGLSIDNLPEDQADILRQEYDRVRTKRRPVARVYSADFDGERQSWERLVLPLSDDGESVTKLLVSAYKLDREPPTVLAIPGGRS
jgi:hypothetical protein